MKAKQSIHVQLPVELHTSVKEFSKARRVSNNSVVVYAIEELFKQESLDPKRHYALKKAIEELFLLPNGYTIRSFWVTLCMLAIKYSSFSSKAYWGDTVYLGLEDKTHRQIFLDLKIRIEGILKNV